jgi:hypothetical protein
MGQSWTRQMCDDTFNSSTPPAVSPLMVNPFSMWPMHSKNCPHTPTEQSQDTLATLLNHPPFMLVNEDLQFHNKSSTSGRCKSPTLDLARLACWRYMSIKPSRSGGVPGGPWLVLATDYFVLRGVDQTAILASLQRCPCQSPYHWDVEQNSST